MQFDLGTATGREQWNEYLAARNVATTMSQDQMMPDDKYVQDQYMEHYNAYIQQQQHEQQSQSQHENLQMASQSQMKRETMGTSRSSDEAKYFEIALSDNSNEDLMSSDDEEKTAAALQRPPLSIDTSMSTTGYQIRGLANKELSSGTTSAVSNPSTGPTTTSTGSPLQSLASSEVSTERVRMQASNPVILAASNYAMRNLDKASFDARKVWDASDHAATRMRQYQRSASGSDVPDVLMSAHSGIEIQMPASSSLMAATKVRDTQSVPVSPFTTGSAVLPRVRPQHQPSSPTTDDKRIGLQPSMQPLKQHNMQQSSTTTQSTTGGNKNNPAKRHHYNTGASPITNKKHLNNSMRNGAARSPSPTGERSKTGWANTASNAQTAQH